MHKQLRMQFGESHNPIIFEDFEEAKEDNFYSEHTLVYTKNPASRMHTPDDILQDNLESYFDQILISVCILHSWSLTQGLWN